VGVSETGVIEAEGIQDNILLTSKLVIEELDWVAFKLGESTVRYLALQVRKPGELGEVTDEVTEVRTSGIRS